MDFRHARSTCAFALAGAANGVLSTLSYAPPFLDQYGAAALAHELALQLAANFLLGCGLTLALRGQLSQPARSLQRPGRFLLAVAAAAAPLCWLGGILEASAHHGRLVLLPPTRWDFLEGWLAILLWGGLFAWLYLLYLQRAADQLRLNAVLAERAMLSRRLAQTELLAARARVDPATVAGVLRQVQARYAQDPRQGAELLEQLVGYLRLALNRGGSPDERAAAALHALREEANA